MDASDSSVPENAKEQQTVIVFQLKLSKWVLIVIGFFYFIAVIGQLLVAANLIKAEPVNQLWDASKTILLPIVTLVIGHYFGTKSSSNET